MQGIYQRLAADAARTIPAFDGAGNAWSVENPSGAPAAAGLVIARGKPVPEADYQNSRALTLESFDDAVAYRMSETNAFEKFVLGGGKQLLKEGPARAGVTHSFTVAAAGARAGKSCATYTATNTGAAGGWCAVGRRLAEPVDLSRYPGIGLWIQGDARREVMRLQFRDTAGRHADWLVPIDFSGWRLHVFRTAEAADFDWRRVEYVLFYYNDLPAGATCALKFDDLKALPALGASPALRRPALVVNGRRIALPAALQPEESLTLDGSGRLTLWRKGKVVGKPVALRGAPLLLQPGANQVSLECDASAGAPSDVSVRVVPLR